MKSKRASRGGRVIQRSVEKGTDIKRVDTRAVKSQTTRRILIITQQLRSAACDPGESAHAPWSCPGAWAPWPRPRPRPLPVAVAPAAVPHEEGEDTVGAQVGGAAVLQLGHNNWVGEDAVI